MYESSLYMVLDRSRLDIFPVLSERASLVILLPSTAPNSSSDSSVPPLSSVSSVTV